MKAKSVWNTGPNTGPRQALLSHICLFKSFITNSPLSPSALTHEVKQVTLLLLQLLAPRLLLLQSLLEAPKLLLHESYLLLCLCALQQWFDLEIELHPGPVLDPHEGPNIPLDYQQGIPGKGARRQGAAL